MGPEWFLPVEATLKGWHWDLISGGPNDLVPMCTDLGSDFCSVLINVCFVHWIVFYAFSVSIAKALRLLVIGPWGLSGHKHPVLELHSF